MGKDSSKEKIIYLWYNKDRWLKERFKGDESLGLKLIEEYLPQPAVDHYCHSYASFRVNGFEYARLFPNGKIRYGIQHAPLNEESIKPSELVSSLEEIFRLLSESPKDALSIEEWAKTNFKEDMSHFLIHTIHYHQKEHWLESILLANPSCISDSIDEIVSQVVVAYRGDKASRRGFIDLLALDNQNKQLWVIELKAEKATVLAIRQAARYAKWTRNNVHYLLDESFGYFKTVDHDNQYKIGIILIATDFSSNIERLLKEKLPCYHMKILQVNTKWRKKPKIISAKEFLPIKTSKENIFEEELVWQEDPVFRKILEISKRHDLYHRYTHTNKYVNLCKSSINGPVVAQFHKSSSDRAIKILVIGDSDEARPKPKNLERVKDYKVLSGDFGSNKPWLRGTGKLFGHRNPAQLYILPKTVEKTEEWNNIEQLIAYASNKFSTFRESSVQTIIITHGDVDGMVCAAQLIHREKSNCNLIFSNAKYIKSSLARILRSSQKPRRVYISDIPANLEVIKIMSALSEDGTEIFWIDHHPWQDGVKEAIQSYCARIVYNESLQTPAGILMGRWLKDEDPYYEQIGKICFAYEKGTEWERNWFRLLSSYIGNSDRDVLERLAYNQDFTEDDLKRIKQKKKDEQAAEEILKNTPKTMSTHSGKSMAVYDTSEKKGIYLGHKVFEHHDVDYCLIRISQTKWQLASNPSHKYSMKHLMGKHNIGENNISIAGRENELLAIENQSSKNFDAELHELLTGWLCKSL